MTHPGISRLKPVCVAAAVALMALPLAARAAAISLEASYALDGSTMVHPIGNEGTLVPFDAVFPTGDAADFYLYKQSDAGSNVFFHTYGGTGASSPTYFGARASGQGDFSASTSATYTDRYVNHSGGASNVAFTFNVDFGELGLFGQGTGQASLLLQVMVNGTVVSRGYTKIVQDSSGVICSEDDLGALGSYMSCSSPSSRYANGSGGPFTVDLGLVADGEALDVEYDIVSTTSGTYTSGDVDCNLQGGYGYGGYGLTAVFEGPSFCPRFNGVARSGDPFNLPLDVRTPGGSASLAAFAFDSTAASVPEPTSLGLLGAAAAAAALRRRRRQAPR